MAVQTPGGDRYTSCDKDVDAMFSFGAFWGDGIRDEADVEKMTGMSKMPRNALVGVGKLW